MKKILIVSVVLTFILGVIGFSVSEKESVEMSASDVTKFVQTGVKEVKEQLQTVMANELEIHADGTSERGTWSILEEMSKLWQSVKPLFVHEIHGEEVLVNPGQAHTYVDVPNATEGSEVYRTKNGQSLFRKEAVDSTSSPIEDGVAPDRVIVIPE